MVVKLDFVKPDDELLQLIALNIRPADRDELLAAGNKTVIDALYKSVKLSKTSVVACHNGTPLVIYGMGVPNQLGNTALPWMLGTVQSERFKREFMVYTARVIKEMLIEFPRLVNFVYHKNIRSIKWLKALGFTIDDAKPYGPYGELFHRFHMEDRNHV